MLELKDYSVGYQRFPFAPVTWVIKDLSQAFMRGITFLVSPNGTGKSTLLKGILGKGVASTGQMLLNDEPVPVTRRTEVIGFCPQEFRLPRHLQVSQYLEFLAHMCGADAKRATKEVATSLEKVSLEHLATAKLGTLSGGQRRRVGIAQAIMFDRPVLLLDEPTVGLDEEARTSVRDVVRQLSSDRIVIFSTHLEDDAKVMGGEIFKIGSQSRKVE
ncbi:ATP-binding cassette domain-containing protein [Micrococcales bacterium 31B]|nr:ATP-binding cassette domain-containing protein [Micrococcales bacterium 31B]